MPRTARRPSHASYLSQAYFPGLDGLRAVSILLVVTLHTTDRIWAHLNGSVGVTVFFVISGFLITTLLLREELRVGRARVGSFFVRRAFRILPLYYVTLLAYVLIIGMLHIQAGAEDLWRALPWYLTYQNDFAPGGSGFGHTWSLAVEEKYYLVWPLVFVVPLLRRHRGLLVATLTALAGVVGVWAPGAYVAIYLPILLGCGVALVLHSKRTFEIAQLLATTPVVLVVLLALGLQDWLFEGDSRVHPVFALLTACLMPAVLLGPPWFSRILASRVATYIGTRSYAVYLIHRMAKGVCDRLVAPGSSSVATQLLHTALVVVVSLAGAEILYRTVERPMIAVGRRLSATRRPERSLS